jgi:hypothetical protein
VQARLILAFLAPEHEMEDEDWLGSLLVSDLGQLSRFDPVE